MTHWRQLCDDKEYLFHYDAPFTGPDGKPRDVIVTIEKVVGGTVIGEGGKKNKKPIVHFVGKKKPLILCITNCLTIEKLLGSSDPKSWAGKRIALFATTEMSRDRSRGTYGCIRVRPTAPKGPDDQPEPTAPTERSES